MSQRQTIQKHLIQKGSITARYAALKYGIFRCSARIYELREQGMNIKTIMKDTDANGFGGYAVYKLIKK